MYVGGMATSALLEYLVVHRTLQVPKNIIVIKPISIPSWKEVISDFETVTV